MAPDWAVDTLTFHHSECYGPRASDARVDPEILSRRDARGQSPPKKIMKAWPDPGTTMVAKGASMVTTWFPAEQDTSVETEATPAERSITFAIACKVTLAEAAAVGADAVAVFAVAERGAAEATAAVGALVVTTQVEACSVTAEEATAVGALESIWQAVATMVCGVPPPPSGAVGSRRMTSFDGTAPGRR
jgi:hypothetical protein